VEHFKDDPRRIDRVIRFLRDQSPDVFALLEVEGKTVFQVLTRTMDRYQFHITEGLQTQEILVGVKNGLTAFFTQRTEFKSGNRYLRPGALLTVTINDEHYNLLFLHTKSGSKPIGLGIRDDQFTRAFKFKKTLDKNPAAGGNAKYLFIGDLNVMGMKYPFQKDIDPRVEIQKLDQDAAKVKMRRLSKNKPATWWNGPGSRYAPADLDHVLASQQLKFKNFAGSDIDVRGWPALETDVKKATWIARYSDHALLYMELEK
jgi:hypothetical protein